MLSYYTLVYYMRKFVIISTVNLGTVTKYRYTRVQVRDKNRLNGISLSS